MSSLTKRAEHLLEQAGLGVNAEPEQGKYSLSRSQVLDMLRLRAMKPEATQVEIAAFLGVAQSTVSRWLADYRDSTEDASNLLKANALPASLRVAELMDSKQDKVALDASKAILTANKLLGNEDVKVNVGVQVVIGMSTQPEEGNT